MAINRDAYKSLVESVNEATSMAPSSSKGGVSRIRGGRAAATSNTRTGQIQWGDPSIGGAMNAAELAQWLDSQSSQSAGTSPNDDSNTVSSQRSGKMTNANTLGVSGVERIGSPRNATNSTMRSTPAGVKKFTLPYATDAAGVVSGSRVGSFAQSTGSAKRSSSLVAPQRSTSSNDNSWGGAGVFGAKNAEDLARILSQKSYDGPSTSTGASKGRPKSRKGTVSNRKSGTSGTSGSMPSSKSPMVSVADVQEALDILAEDEEWDILDEILAEGLELYGEDGLEEILADFAETGEMSEELADLIDAAEQLDEAYEAKLKRIADSQARAMKRGDKSKLSKLQSAFQKIADRGGSTKRTRRLKAIANKYDPANLQNDSYRTNTGARASMGLKKRFDPKFGERHGDTKSAYNNVRFG